MLMRMFAGIAADFVRSLHLPELLSHVIAAPVTAAASPAGPPWPHLALLVLLLLGSRSHWLPGVALVVVGGLLATMHARGLRLILRLEDGGRLGLAVIRHGAPVPGVGAGGWGRPGSRRCLGAPEPWLPLRLPGCLPGCLPAHLLS